MTDADFFQHCLKIASTPANVYCLLRAHTLSKAESRELRNLTNKIFRLSLR